MKMLNRVQAFLQRGVTQARQRLIHPQNEALEQLAANNPAAGARDIVNGAQNAVKFSL